RETDDVGALDAAVVEHGGREHGERRDRHGAGRRAGPARARRVEADDVPTREVVDERRPHVCAAADTRDQEQRPPPAVLGYADPMPPPTNELTFHADSPLPLRTLRSVSTAPRQIGLRR